MDDKVTIIEGAYGIIPPDAMTVNEILYHQCEYIKEHAVQGEKGDAATIKVGTTKTLPPGSEASVSNSGDEHNAVFNFALPHGDKGETGATFTPEVSPEGMISWTNDKGLPDPKPANIKGQKGDTGLAATVQVGTVTTLPAGSEATVTNAGDEHNAVFNFALPQGAKGEVNVVANPSPGTDNILEKIAINDTNYNITRIIKAVDTVLQIHEGNLAVGKNVALPTSVKSNTGDLVIIKFETSPSGETGVLFALDEGEGPSMCRVLAIIYDSAGCGLTAQTYTFDGTTSLAQFRDTLETDGATNIISIVPQRALAGGIQITTTEATPRSFTLFAPTFTVTTHDELIVEGMAVEGTESGGGTPTGIKPVQIMVTDSGSSTPTNDMMLLIGGESFASGMVQCNAVPAANWQVTVYRNK